MVARNQPSGAREPLSRAAPDALAKMEALMIRWRIAAQRDCPGGSEYMDPAYFEEFIRLRRDREHERTLAYWRLRKAAQKVLDGLHNRIAAAPRDSVPVFDGIAELAALLGPQTASQAPRKEP